MVPYTQNENEELLSQVNDSITTYVVNSLKSNRFSLPLDQFTLSDFFNDKLLVIQAIRRGFPYSLFSKIQEITPFTEEDWASYLNISLKTLQRHKKEDGFVFKPIHTEKIIELTEVTSYGKEVFGNKELFYNWLNTPSFALGNLKPSELLTDSYGKEMVMAELNRIAHGIFC